MFAVHDTLSPLLQLLLIIHSIIYQSLLVFYHIFPTVVNSCRYTSLLCETQYSLITVLTGPWSVHSAQDLSLYSGLSSFQLVFYFGATLDSAQKLFPGGAEGTMWYQGSILGLLQSKYVLSTSSHLFSPVLFREMLFILFWL